VQVTQLLESSAISSSVTEHKLLTSGPLRLIILLECCLLQPLSHSENKCELIL